MAREIKWRLSAGSGNVLAQGHVKDQHDTLEALARFGERLLTALQSEVIDGPPFGDSLLNVTVWISEEKGTSDPK